MGKISWTGRTWNPTRGCSIVSPGCKHCYAMGIAARFSGPGLPFEGFAYMRNGDPAWTGDVALVDDKLHDPIGWSPGLVFAGSASDLGHEVLTDDDRDEVFRTMAMSQQCVFQVLTKRPEVLGPYLDGAAARVRDEFMDHRYEDTGSRRGRRLFGPKVKRTWPGWPLPNVWIGVSAESQRFYDERVYQLLHMRAVLRFVSMEPLLGPIWPWARLGGLADPRAELAWGIVGGEAGPRTCDLAWIEDIVAGFARMQLPLWVKQLGSHPASLAYVGPAGQDNARPQPIPRDQLDSPLYRIRVTDKAGKGEDLDDYPVALRVRQMPRAWTERVAVP